MRIIIDADACPSIDLIESLAKFYKIPVIIVADNTHVFNSNYSKVIIVDKGFGSTDIKIENTAIENDIVITQDYGVAVVCLAKKCYVINPKGYIYDNQNIDNLITIRHINYKLRKNNIHIKGPKKRTRVDDDRLLSNIENIIKNHLSNCN